MTGYYNFVIFFKSINPFTEETIAEYPHHHEKEIVLFIENLHKGYQSWKSTALDERLRLVRFLQKTLLQKKNNVAKLITDEMDKPIIKSFAEIDKSILLCDYYYENSHNFLRKNLVKTEYSNSYYQYSPLGVILGIMPWNFPLWQLMRFAIPNLILGNTILLKHAPNTTGVSLAIENLIAEIFPSGVFKSIIVDIPVIEKILKHEFITGVSITGSKKAGAAVAKIAGQNIKKSVLELGGNDPFIVFDDADLKNAVHQCVTSRLLNSGQVCVAAKRIILHKNIAADFQQLLLKSLADVAIGEVSPKARPKIVKIERQF